MNGNGVDKLIAAKRERSRLQAALADVAARRERAGGPLDALTAAESAADNEALAAAVAKWMHGGSKGARPVREDFTHGASTPEVLAARHAVAMALPGIEKLNIEHSNISAQLSAARAAVLDAAARQKAADFEALADRAKELREELADIEEELAAGYHHFVEQSDHDFAMTGKRNPALLLPQQAALAGFYAESVAVASRSAATKRTSPRERCWTRHFVKTSTKSRSAYVEKAGLGLVQHRAAAGSGSV